MIPLATTTFTQRRPDPDADPYETRTVTIVATGIRGHLDSPSGTEQAIGGQLEEISAVALLEPTTDLQHTDELVDETTGNEYRISWVRQRVGLGLDHTKAGVAAFHGASVG